MRKCVSIYGMTNKPKEDIDKDNVKDSLWEDLVEAGTKETHPEIDIEDDLVDHKNINKATTSNPSDTFIKY